MLTNNTNYKGHYILIYCLLHFSYWICCMHVYHYRKTNVAIELMLSLSLNWYLFHPFLSGDVPRVNGQLAVSRAFGDKSLKSHLRSDPDIQDSYIDTNTDVLVLASDGLWKVNIFTSSFSSCCNISAAMHLEEFT